MMFLASNKGLKIPFKSGSLLMLCVETTLAVSFPKGQMTNWEWSAGPQKHTEHEFYILVNHRVHIL